MSTAARRRLSRTFLIGLGAVRLVEGVIELLAPRWFVRRLGVHEPASDLQLGMRMKGGRDVALGVITLAARGDDGRLADLAVATVVIDASDALAVVLDGGRTLPSPAYPGGAVLGVVVAIKALWAHRQLSG